MVLKIGQRSEVKRSRLRDLRSGVQGSQEDRSNGKILRWLRARGQGSEDERLEVERTRVRSRGQWSEVGGQEVKVHRLFVQKSESQ